MANKKGTKASTHGGTRKGSGRKKGSKNQSTIEKEAIRELFRERVMERWDDVVDAALELAVGVQIEKKNPATNKKVVFQKPPNSDMLKYLMDQVIDKPKQRVEVETKDEVDETLSAAEEKQLDDALSYGFAPQHATSDQEEDQGE